MHHEGFAAGYADAPAARHWVVHVGMGPPRDAVAGGQPAAALGLVEEKAQAQNLSRAAALRAVRCRRSAPAAAAHAAGQRLAL